MSRQPNHLIRRLCRSYQTRHQMKPVKLGHDRYVTVDSSVAMRIADEFEVAHHNPDDPLTKTCYRALCIETRLQWDFLTDSGFVFEAWEQTGQPYQNSAQMLNDVRTGHLWFFLTANGYGRHEQRFDGSNPLLQSAGVRTNGLQLCFNDVFRAVHDVFGHAKEGYSFGPRGEENAWRQHCTMYSPSARRAMTTETRVQNCWVNFGPHMRDSDGQLLDPSHPAFLSMADRPYAEQKIVLLPLWASNFDPIGRH